MPRYDDYDWEERRYDRGGQYQGNEPYLSSNLYNRSGRSDTGLDGGGTRLYIGRLSSRTRSQDLEDLFTKYGRVRDVDMKHNFAFVEFLDVRDADDARYYTNGKDLDGSRLIVEFARRGPRGLGGGREYLGSGPTPGTGRCYNCGNEGHWARDCKAGDWRDKCYRCGQRGHIERNCQNSPTFNSSLSRSRSRSRSPRGHGKSQKYFAQSRSRSYSSSPPIKKDHNPIKDSRKRPLMSKSKSVTPPPKEVHSIFSSPKRTNASPSPCPKLLQAKENLIVQESQQDLSRSTSHSPTMDMEKLSPNKGDSEKREEE